MQPAADPSSSSLSCTTAFLVPRHGKGPFPFFIFLFNDELINTATIFRMSSGTWDAHPLRREAVTPNEKTRDANATTKGAEAKPVTLGG